MEGQNLRYMMRLRWVLLLGARWCWALSSVRDQFDWSRAMMPTVEAEALTRPERGEATAVLASVFGADSRSMAAASAELENSEGAVRTVRGVLCDAACERLRAFCDGEMDAQLNFDNTDKLPDFQVNIDFDERLEALVGADEFRALRSLPSVVFGHQRGFERVGCFVRRYAADERPFMRFHIDGNAFTANVALSSSEDHVGGELVALYDSRCRAVPRRKGAATVHSGALCHAVSPLTSGVRYSLILFFHAAQV